MDWAPTSNNVWIYKILLADSEMETEYIVLEATKNALACTNYDHC